MNNSVVRITGIKVNNLKDVICGDLFLTNPRKNYKSSILGLYGQNGFGKTALIDAVDILQFALGDFSVPNYYAEYINVISEFAKFSFDFNVKTQCNENFDIRYEFKLIKVINDSTSNDNSSDKVVIADEILKYAFKSNGSRQRFKCLINTSDIDIFSPQQILKIIAAKDKNIITDLVVAKKFTSVSSRSFVFSKEFLSIFRQRSESNDGNQLQVLYRILQTLSNFGKSGIFVVKTSNQGLISLNMQPLFFKYMKDNLDRFARITLPLDSPTVIDHKILSFVEKTINNMNIVLSQIVPNLTIAIKRLGSQIMDNDKVGERIQLMSCKNDKEIALRYESEGIKKIIAVLQLLIVVYNQPSITVAIDELDSGIFEYLLGEILRIVSEEGKGQLIFTSHNLRPLETLDKGFVAFTTTNPERRYTKISNVKESNNLRDMYYRSIILGESKENLYDVTHNSEIAFAFKEVGENDES